MREPPEETEPITIRGLDPPETTRPSAQSA